MSRDTAAVLASCPQGAPLEVLDDLGFGAPDVPVAVQRGPAGRRWAVTTGSSPVVDGGAAALIDRWPSDGWDYLRRGGVTTTSGTPEQRRDGHDAYLLGMAILDPELTLDHLAARSDDLASAGTAEATEIHAFAMQLATTIGTDDRRRQAVEFGRRALRHAPTGDERFRILLDIGVAHAALRDGESLDRAAAVCAQARALPEPGGDVAQLVRLLNLEALVAYHRGLDHEAIDLEARALELSATGDPAAVDMAPTLRRNMARVLSRRLGDNDGAARLLACNVEGRAAAHASRARDVVELACAYFDEGRFDDVVRTLQSDDRRSLDLELDVVGYTLLIRSLVAIGEVDRARSLLPALRRSAALLGCDAAFAPTA